MSWNSSWPTILKSLGKLSLLGLYLTEWGLLAFHDLRTFVIIRRIFLLNYLRARQFELYGEFYMFSWWKDLRQMPRRNPRLGMAKELSQNLPKRDAEDDLFGYQTLKFHSRSSNFRCKGRNFIPFLSLENSRDKRKFWKGSPVFPIGTFRMEIRLPFTSFLCFVLVSCCNSESSLVRCDNPEILGKW